MEFKHLKILLFSAIVLSASILGAIAILGSQSQKAKTEGNHFSVLWKGFSPDYSNQYPDYYICINNLKDDTLNMHIAMQIQNFENTSYWFLIEQYTTPPTGWTIAPYYIGRISVDETKTFTYSSIARTKPTTIPEGRVTESVDLVVEAYYDASYTKFYNSTNFTVNFHFIDLESAAWTLLYYDNFDDGSRQGWGTYYSSSEGIKSFGQYRSWPCSYYFYGSYDRYGISKTFDTTGPYTETYLISSIRPDGGGNFRIRLNGELTFYSDIGFAGGTWYHIAIPLPLSLSTNVRIHTDSWAYLDDVYVIAK